MFEMVKQINAILKFYLCFKIKLFSVSLFIEIINSITMWMCDIYCVEMYLSLQNCNCSKKKPIDFYLGFFMMHPYYFKNDQANQYWFKSLFMFPNEVVYLSLFLKLIRVFMYMYDINCIETYISLLNCNCRKY